MYTNHNKIKQINRKNRNLTRLLVVRSNRAISVSLIDDRLGVTITSLTTLKMDSKLKPKEKSKALGKEIALKALEKKIPEVLFDKGKYKYHGNIKVLAESARENGLKF